MNCEICGDKDNRNTARHAYIYDVNGPCERFHFYCEEHFLMFCKTVVDKQ